MSVVRLKCPACDSIVRINDATAAEHRVVRCGKCQGLVNTVVARLPDLPPTESHTALRAADFDPEGSPKPTRKRKQSTAGLTTNPRTLLAAAGGLVILALLCFGGYLLATSSSAETPYERTTRQTLEKLDTLVTAFEEMKSPADVPAFAQKAKGTLADLQGVQAELATMTPPTPEEMRRTAEKFKPKVEELQRRLLAGMVRLQTNPELALAFSRELNQLGPQLMMAVAGGLGGGFNLDMAKGLLAQGRPTTNGIQASPSPDARRLSTIDVDLALNKKTVLMRALIDGLRSISDAGAAADAAPVLNNTLTDLTRVQQDLKNAERAGTNATPAVAAQATREQADALQDLLRQIARVAGLPGVSRHLAQLDQRMKDLGLVQTTSFNRQPEAPDATDGKNPFEQVSRTQEKNPFETVKPGSKPASEHAASNAALDTVLEQLQGTDTFKRRDGVRELLNIRFDESRKGEVLDALLNLMEDADSNLKGDTFKAFRRWAKTKEDKERLGKVMEALLNDEFLKKDIIKFAADNKLVSASTELARLLKDNIYRLEAARALIAIGPEAEKPTLPYVTDLEPQVRRMAIEVLAQIGSNDSLPELSKVQNDRYVGAAAREALRVVKTRNKDK